MIKQKQYIEKYIYLIDYYKFKVCPTEFGYWGKPAKTDSNVMK